MMDKEKIARTVINSEITKDENADRISSLPDSVLTDILSRLKAEEVIQTCILSKRWSKLWTFVPCLDFCVRQPESEETEARDLERFENFVSTFLRLRDDATDLHTFRLWHLKSNSASAITWIIYALKHNPKRLKIVLRGRDRIHLPNFLFTCDSLEDIYLDMEMDGGKAKIKPDTVRLPRLKKLYFRYVSLKGAYMEKLIFGCRNLQCLSMYDCDLKLYKNVSFWTLKYLDIRDCSFIGKFIPPLSISAPYLKFLSLSVNGGDVIKLIDMYNVTKARIFSTFFDQTTYHCELLSSLSRVENLELSSCFSFKEMLEKEIWKCPMFLYLKKLSLGEGCMFCNFSVLSSFLRHCPNVETLVLSHTDVDCYEYGEDFHIRQDEDLVDQNERIVCNRLRWVNIRFKTNDKDVDRLVRLLLQSTLEIRGVLIALSRIGS